MKIEVNATVNVHLHLPPVFTDDGVEEILTAIAILAKDERMTTASVTRLIAASAALATQVATTNTDVEAVVQLLRDADDSTDLNAIADQLEGLTTASKTAADDAQAAIDAHNAAPADTTTGGQGSDTLAGGNGSDTLTGGQGADTQAAPEGGENA